MQIAALPVVNLLKLWNAGAAVGNSARIEKWQWRCCGGVMRVPKTAVALDTVHRQ